MAIQVLDECAKEFPLIPIHIFGDLLDRLPRDIKEGLLQLPKELLYRWIDTTLEYSDGGISSAELV
eukprot:6550235-Heterocapsa_arctica.AAC.1